MIYEPKVKKGANLENFESFETIANGKVSKTITKGIKSLNKLNAVRTHNKHIFVRPKKLC